MFSLSRFFCVSPKRREKSRFTPLPFHAVLLFQVFIANATAQAVTTITILLLQLDERLTIGRVLHDQSTIYPSSDNIVVLGFQLFEQRDRLFAMLLTILAATITIIERSDRINEQQSDGVEANV